LVDWLNASAVNTHATPAQIALAWLTPDDLREIDRAATRIDVHGAPYPEHLQKMVGR